MVGVLENVQEVLPDTPFLRYHGSVRRKKGHAENTE